MAGPQPRDDAIDESLRSRFEAAWRDGRPEPIERFLPDENDARYLLALEELIRIELDLAWTSWSTRLRDGSAEPHHQTLVRPSQLEEYLERFPKLNRPEIVLRLVGQERSVRNAHGEDVSVDEYRLRFPALEIADQPPRSEPPMPGEPGQDTQRTEALPTGQMGDQPPQSEPPMAGEPGQDTQRTEALPTGQVGDQPPRSELPMLSEPGPDTQQAASATGESPGGAPSVSSLEEFGNYESLEEIGRGGMGVVYRARQRSANRTVALKVIRRDRLEALPRDTHTSALERFRQEAQAAARLEHENIVTVYEVGEVDRQPFFSMRYVDGQSLSQILREGPMGNRQAAGYLEPVARALHEAHSLGILHRDLKPQNILVDKKTDRALVADFGLAKLTEGQEELTREGEVMGTPPYMSPEQAKDSARVTAQTDVYALGATLYHVLTGRPPFQAANPLETLRQVIDEEAAPPRQLNPSIDRDLETVCLKCLEKEPTRRYDSAHALADDLRRYLNGEPILARPIGVFGRVVRWRRRKPALATAIAVAFLAG
ncbi:MAG: serine/threonine-protein kinase, partial [Planctomycetota bacterium]